MTNDLHRMFHDVADSAGSAADLGPVEALIGRRQRRRAARRTTAGTLTVAGLAAVVLAGTTLLDTPDVAPAHPSPSPSPTAAAGALPGCGQVVDTQASPTWLTGALVDVTPTTLDAGDALTATATLTVSDPAAIGNAAVVADPDSRAAALLLLREGVVVGTVVPGADGLARPDTWRADATTPASLELGGVVTPCSPAGQDTGRLATGSYELVAAVPVAIGTTGSAGLLVTAPTTVTVPLPQGAGGGQDGGDATTLPLKDPWVPRFDGTNSIVSATPTSEDRLEDGDYFGTLVAVDAKAGTVSFDVGIFYGGQAADDWWQVNDPAELALDYRPSWLVVDDVQRTRTVTVSPSLVLTLACSGDGDPSPAQVPGALGDLGSGDKPRAGCSWESGLREYVTSGQDWYWFDVRGGEIVQMVGQYIP